MTPREYISRFKKKTGRLPSQVEISKDLKISPQKAIQVLIAVAQKPHREQNAVRPPVKKELEPVREPKKVDISNKWIAAGLFFVAILTSGLSIYFTGLWFTKMFSLVIAGSISVSMVVYMVLSPQAVRYVKGIVKAPLWVSFAIALVFSMGSTVAGQYNKLTENVDIGATNERVLLKLLRQEESELLASIEVDRDQQRFHQTTLERLSGSADERKENSGYIWTERNKVNELAEAISTKQERLTVVREDIRKELVRGSTGATEERKDFYSWLAALLKIEKNMLEFWVAALPAVFIDIIAALSLNIALSVRRKE